MENGGGGEEWVMEGGGSHEGWKVWGGGRREEDGGVGWREE